jgi:hypothetical protein
MNIFERAYRAVVAYLSTPAAEVIEKEIAVVAVPLAEKAVAGIAAVNPTVSVLVQIAEPVIATELEKGK